MHLSVENLNEKIVFPHPRNRTICNLNLILFCFFDEPRALGVFAWTYALKPSKWPRTTNTIKKIKSHKRFFPSLRIAPFFSQGRRMYGRNLFARVSVWKYKFYPINSPAAENDFIFILLSKTDRGCEAACRRSSYDPCDGYTFGPMYSSYLDSVLAR